METLKSEALHFATVSEGYRKEFASCLQNEKVKNERSLNQIIELRYQHSIKNMENDIMGDQLKSLFIAINSLGEGKKQADKKQFELDDVLRRVDDIHFDKNVQESELQIVRHTFPFILF